MNTDTPPYPKIYKNILKARSATKVVQGIDNKNSTDTSSSVRSADSIDDLKKIARKINRLVERLDSL